ncbi:hypothetical protein ACFLS1_03485 [Verrucomicrobiota bacterium]
MKKSIIGFCVMAFCMSVFCVPAYSAKKNAFVAPTDKQIVAIAKKPALLAVFIKNANEDQAVDILLRAIAAVEKLGLNEKAAKQRVGLLLSETAKAKGAAAPAIIARVVKKVNPRLLPVIPKGAMPAVPPKAPKYARQ